MKCVTFLWHTHCPFYKMKNLIRARVNKCLYVIKQKMLLFSPPQLHHVTMNINFKSLFLVFPNFPTKIQLTLSIFVKLKMMPYSNLYQFLRQLTNEMSCRSDQIKRWNWRNTEGLVGLCLRSLSMHAG